MLAPQESRKRAKIEPAAASASSDPVSPSDDWLDLNISGTRILARRFTLRAISGSVLAVMFDPASFFTFDRDARGSILLDRDAEAFQWILGVLRREGMLVTPPPEILVDRVRNEADYFGLDDIVRFVDGCKTEPKTIKKEQKIVTDKVEFDIQGRSKEFLLQDGWLVKSISCIPMQGYQCDSSLSRTVVMERDVRPPAPNAISLRINGELFDYKKAKFGRFAPFAALSASAHIRDNGYDEHYLDEEFDIAGKVAFVRRQSKDSTRLSFFDTARLVRAGGAVALVVVQCPNNDLEEMEADSSTEEVDIPVLMVNWYHPDSNNHFVEIGEVGSRR